MAIGAVTSEFVVVGMIHQHFFVLRVIAAENLLQAFLLLQPSRDWSWRHSGWQVCKRRNCGTTPRISGRVQLAILAHLVHHAAIGIGIFRQGLGGRSGHRRGRHVNGGTLGGHIQQSGPRCTRQRSSSIGHSSPNRRLHNRWWECSIVTICRQWSRSALSRVEVADCIFVDISLFVVTRSGLLRVAVNLHVRKQHLSEPSHHIMHCRHPQHTGTLSAIRRPPRPTR